MSESNHLALRSEIAEKVGAEIIATRDTQAIADALSVGRVRRVLVPIADLQAHMQTVGIWWAIKGAARNPEHPAHAAADVVMDVASARYENVDLTLPLVDVQFTALVAAGLMAQADLDALHAMSIKDDPVTEFDVRRACWAEDEAEKWLL